MVVRVGPGVSKCKPERSKAHQDVTQWFQRWCATNGLAVRDLAAGLHVTTAVARKKLSGENPLSFVDLMQFSGRHRVRLLVEFQHQFCRSSDDGLFAHG